MFVGLGLLFRMGELDKSSAHPKLKPALLTDEQYPWAKTDSGMPKTIKSNATGNEYLSFITENFLNKTRLKGIVSVTFFAIVLKCRICGHLHIPHRKCALSICGRRHRRFGSFNGSWVRFDLSQGCPEAVREEQILTVSHP